MESLSPAISVIVPIYNVEEYLPSCVDSILRQNFKNFECILVDDGSTDNCPALCDKYTEKDMRIKVIHRNNGGLSAARNSGIEKSGGDFIVFVDADDFVEPDYLKVLYELCQKYNTKMSACSLYEFEDNTPINAKICLVDYFYQTTTPLCLTADVFLTKMNYMQIVNGCVCKLYHKSLFSAVRFPVGIIYEDVATVYKLAGAATKIAYTSLELYAYRRHRPNSITFDKNAEQALDGIVVAKQLLRDCEDCPKDVYNSAITRAIRLVLLVFVRLEPPEYLREMKEIWQYVRKYRIRILLNPNAGKKVKAMLFLSFCGMRIANYVARRIDYGSVR